MFLMIKLNILKKDESNSVYEEMLEIEDWKNQIQQM